MLSFEQALAIVREKVTAARPNPGTERATLLESWRRVLAETAIADRDYPPFNRSTRDGYALRSADVNSAPVILDCLSEIRAGEYFEGKIGSGQCVRIMTGAPVPEGADAVVMVEFTRAEDSRIEIQRTVAPFENVVRKGSEAVAGSPILDRGRRLGPAEIGLLAAIGRAEVEVFRQPEVSIIPTGDEVVPIERTPEWFQVRNSNATALAAQVEAAGGTPRIIGIAPDERNRLRSLIEEGRRSDMLLLSGGISAGKYDLVKDVLNELGAEFFFHGVAIRPGKPLAFGRVGHTFFFALPGNPVSTYVTFELFARPAVSALGGGEFDSPVFLRARLGEPIRLKLNLTAFVPSHVEMQENGPVVKRVEWQGSGDLVGVAASNCFIVIPPDQGELAQGDWVQVLLKPS